MLQDKLLSYLMAFAVNTDNKKYLQFLLAYQNWCKENPTTERLFIHWVINQAKDKRPPALYHWLNFMSEINQQCRIHKIKSLWDEKDFSGDTVLHVAIKNNHWLLVKSLLELGASLELPDAENSLPLNLAIKRCPALALQIIDYFLKEKLFISKEIIASAITTAAEINHNEVLEKTILLAKKRFPEEKLITHKCPSKGNTPLHFAVMHKNLVMVKILIKLEADINSVNKKENSPLHLAVKNNDWLLVKYLLDNGANINITNQLSDFPITLAIKLGHTDLALQMIEYIAKKRIICCPQLLNDMVLLAAKKNNLAIFKKIDQFSHKIFPDDELATNSKDNKERTPLHYAVKHKNLAMAKILKNIKVSFDSKDKKGETALHLAIKNNDKKFVEYLLQFHADYQIKTAKQLYPLSLAIKQGHTELALQLIKHICYEEESLGRISAEKAAEIFSWAILDAAKANNLEIIKKIKNIFTISRFKQKFKTNCSARTGNSALHEAVLHGNLAMFKMLWFLTDDWKKENNKGINILVLAINEQKWEIAFFLLSQKKTAKEINLSLEASSKILFNFIATYKKEEKKNEKIKYAFTKLMLDYGANPYHPVGKFNAFQMLCLNGDFKIAKLLLAPKRNSLLSYFYNDDNALVAALEEDTLLFIECAEKGLLWESKEISEKNKKILWEKWAALLSEPLLLLKKTNYQSRYAYFIAHSLVLNSDIENKTTAEKNYFYSCLLVLLCYDKDCYPKPRAWMKRMRLVCYAHLMPSKSTCKIFDDENILNSDPLSTLTLFKTLYDNDVLMQIENFAQKNPSAESSSELKTAAQEIFSSIAGSIQQQQEEKFLTHLKLFTHFANSKFFKYFSNSLWMKDDQGNNLLHLACAAGNVWMVQTLVELGFDINAENGQKNTPLHIAAENGHAHVVQYLLRQQADICKFNIDYSSPLSSAIARGHNETALAIIEFISTNYSQQKDKRKILNQAVLTAAKYNNLYILQALIEKGDVKTCKYISRLSERDPIHYAVIHQNIELLKLLLVLVDTGHQDPDRDITDAEGSSALDFAIDQLLQAKNTEEITLNTKMIRLLLAHSAVFLNKGLPPAKLKALCLQGNFKLIRALVQNNWDLLLKLAKEDISWLLECCKKTDLLASNDVPLPFRQEISRQLKDYAHILLNHKNVTKSSLYYAQVSMVLELLEQDTTSSESTTVFLLKLIANEQETAIDTEENIKLQYYLENIFVGLEEKSIKKFKNYLLVQPIKVFSSHEITAAMVLFYRLIKNGVWQALEQYHLQHQGISLERDRLTGYFEDIYAYVIKLLAENNSHSIESLMQEERLLKGTSPLLWLNDLSFALGKPSLLEIALKQNNMRVVNHLLGNLWWDQTSPFFKTMLDSFYCMLCEAVKNDQIERVELLLANCPVAELIINRHDALPYKNELFKIISTIRITKDTQAFEALLKKPAYLTLLHYAVINNNNSMIKLLMRYGAKATIQNKKIAVTNPGLYQEKKELYVMQEIFDVTGQIDGRSPKFIISEQESDTPLHLAIRQPSPSMVSVLISLLDEEEYTKLLETKNSSGDTPLSELVNLTDTEKALEILDALIGALEEKKVKEGVKLLLQLLSLAIAKSNTRIITYLLDFSIIYEKNYKNSQMNNYLLTEAVKLGNVEIVKLLLTHESFMNLLPKNLNNLLLCAINEKNIKMLRCLLQYEKSALSNFPFTELWRTVASSPEIKEEINGIFLNKIKEFCLANSWSVKFNPKKYQAGNGEEVTVTNTIYLVLTTIDDSSLTIYQKLHAIKLLFMQAQSSTFSTLFLRNQCAQERYAFIQQLIEESWPYQNQESALAVSPTLAQ